MKGFAGLRNFSIDTLDGERLVQADSYWVLMDLVNYVPVKVPEIFRENTCFIQNLIWNIFRERCMCQRARA